MATLVLPLDSWLIAVLIIVAVVVAILIAVLRVEWAEQKEIEDLADENGSPSEP